PLSETNWPESKAHQHRQNLARRSFVCSRFEVQSSTFDVLYHSKMGFVRPFLAHGFRTALRVGGDARGRAREPRLAGLENFRTHSRGDGLRADLCDGVQSHR